MTGLEEEQGLVGEEKEEEEEEESTSKEEVCEKLLEEIGFGRVQYELFLVAGLGWCADVADLFSAGLLIPVLENEFSVSKWELGLVSSVTFVGMLLGAWGWGAVGDLVGRRTVLYWTSALTFLAGLLGALSWSFDMFLICRLLVGVSLGGNLPVNFSLFLEWTPASKRPTATILLTGWSIVATFVATSLGWLLLSDNTPRWREFVALLACISFLCCLLLPWVCESPRFLVAAGCIEDAAHVLYSAAKRNGRVIGDDESIYRLLLAGDEAELCGQEEEEVRHSLQRLVVPFARARRLFSTTALAKQTLMLLPIWFFGALGFYSFSTWMPSMMKQVLGQRETYKVLDLSILLQFPSLALAIWLQRVRGSQIALAVFLGIDGMAMVTFAFLQTEVGAILSAALFNFGCSGYFGVLYLYTNECFPTYLRTTGFGFCSASNRLGGMSVPVFAGWLVQHSHKTACLVFAVFFFLGACSSLVSIKSKSLKARQGSPQRRRVFE